MVAAGSSSSAGAGRELLVELQRGSRQVGENGDANRTYLPSYNSKLVRACLDELHQSAQTMQHEIQLTQQRQRQQKQKQKQQEESPMFSNDDGDNDDESSQQDSGMPMKDRPSLLLHSAIIERQKRYLLAYHRSRMETLQRRYLLNGTTSMSRESSTGANGASSSLDAPSNPGVFPQEAEFIKRYMELRSNYAAAAGCELGLVPPASTSHMVQVRVLESQGDVMLSSGRSVRLTRGSIHFVPRTDVQSFLHEGSLEIVDGEEMVN